MDVDRRLNRARSESRRLSRPLLASSLIGLLCFLALVLPLSTRAALNYARGTDGPGGVASGRGVIVFTLGYAPRNYNQIYKYFNRTWRLAYCSSDSNSDGTGLPYNCNAWVTTTGTSVFTDWRTCGYCFARAVNEDDDASFGWTLYTG